MIHNGNRRGSGLGWYYLGFAFMAFGLGAAIVYLATGQMSLQFTPWRPIASILAVAAIGGYLKLRQLKRGG